VAGEQVYDIFLMTRVGEETTRTGARYRALTGLATLGGVITSAGVVLAGTFLALGTLPVTMLAELGFAVAFGVLPDTIAVRSVLVTALNLDLGRWVWWPSALARRPVRTPSGRLMVRRSRARVRPPRAGRGRLLRPTARWRAGRPRRG
jgi:putative drug exporter of the RND superfamily